MIALVYVFELLVIVAALALSVIGMARGTMTIESVLELGAVAALAMVMVALADWLRRETKS